MKTLLARALVGALLPLSLVPTAAQAIGTGEPQILGPQAGQTFEFGWTGPVDVNLADAPVGSYAVSVTCPNYSWTDRVAYDGQTDVVSFALPAVRPSEDVACSASTYNELTPGNAQSVPFTVRAQPVVEVPPLVIDDVSVSPVRFFPRVVDGYRDATEMSFNTHEPARVVARVDGPGGGTVRTAMLGVVDGSDYWAWGGRRNDGRKVLPGIYTMRLTGTAASGAVATVSRRVIVATSTRATNVTERRSGYAASYTRRTSSCYTNRYDYDRTLQLDCWGGRHALAGYRFAIPANARRIHWRVVGEPGCCDPGRIVKTGRRVSRTAYRVQVKVTNWRSYTIERVSVSYTYRRRI